jgi:hypothetical protein
MVVVVDGRQRLCGVVEAKHGSDSSASHPEAVANKEVTVAAGDVVEIQSAGVFFGQRPGNSTQAVTVRHHDARSVPVSSCVSPPDNSW